MKFTDLDSANKWYAEILREAEAKKEPLLVMAELGRNDLFFCLPDCWGAETLTTYGSLNVVGKCRPTRTDISIFGPVSITSRPLLLLP